MRSTHPVEAEKTLPRVPCEIVTEDNLVGGKTETERWGWKEGGPGREKSATLPFRHCCLWKSLGCILKQIQNPSPSDSGSFGLAQGSGPVGKSKNTLGKLPSECLKEKIHIEPGTAGVIPDLVKPVRTYEPHSETGKAQLQPLQL